MKKTVEFNMDSEELDLNSILPNKTKRLEEACKGKLFEMFGSLFGPALDLNFKTHSFEGESWAMILFVATAWVIIEKENQFYAGSKLLIGNYSNDKLLPSEHTIQERVVSTQDKIKTLFERICGDEDEQEALCFMENSGTAPYFIATQLFPDDNLYPESQK